MLHARYRFIFYGCAFVAVGLIEWLRRLYPPVYWAYCLVLPVIFLGLRDILQRKQAIRRNYPLLGRLRYLFEAIRPEINQYFVESDLDGRPFNREHRANVYQRAKKELNTRPFGTKLDVYKEGYEWVNHSISPSHLHHSEPPRVLIGEARCSQSYSASLFNVSAMSYGALSKNAILALNTGAKLGGFYHNSGEGGLSPYHLNPGGDLVYQLGTGYFGSRDDEGRFCPERFQERAQLPSVKMIEVKLSQGAKPGHGGILPKKKITPEIAAIRHVPMDRDALSPPNHTAFTNPIELLEFVTQLRELSGGKPVGFKLCVGNDYEFLAICKAMLKTGLRPDFITVDGSEGGTGAAPMEFADFIGMPLTDGLVLVNNALIGCGLRDDIRVIASGKITTGFHLARHIALGADLCNSARGMMFALGCIQALQCHSNTCPTGVATQDPYLVEGLDPAHKSVRVMQFHKETLHSMLELVSATGLTNVHGLTPHHIYRRVNQKITLRLEDLYPSLASGALLADGGLDKLPEHWRNTWQRAWHLADAESFAPNIKHSDRLPA